MEIRLGVNVAEAFINELAEVSGDFGKIRRTIKRERNSIASAACSSRAAIPVLLLVCSAATRRKGRRTVLG